MSICLPIILRILTYKTDVFQKQAARLHRLDPINYPDSNHKPELALALTRFELLCGFRPSKEIAANLRGRNKIFTIIRNGGNAIFSIFHDKYRRAVTIHLHSVTNNQFLAQRWVPSAVFAGVSFCWFHRDKNAS